jgi:hypothetical protein
MQIEIVNRNVPGNSPAIWRVRDRVARSLERLSHRIERVVVKVESLAERAGSGSRECLVLVRLRGGGEVVVRQRGEGVFGPVFSAIRKARDTIRRRLGRRRSVATRR